MPSTHVDEPLAAVHSSLPNERFPVSNKIESKRRQRALASPRELLYPSFIDDGGCPLDPSLADKLKALSHPARLEILEVLARRGTCVCGEIVEVMPLAQSTVSEHLRILKEAGLVHGTIEGKRSCYCLDAGQLARLRCELEALFVRLERGAGSCAQAEAA